jgi:O-antigen ligase
MKSKTFNLFIFFLAFPCVSIYGISVTFYLFLIYLILNKRKLTNPFKSLIYLGLFFSLLISQYISFFITEIIQEDNLSILKKIITFIYWLSIAMFFESKLKIQHLFFIKKYMFYGLLASILTFYFFKFSFDLGPIEFSYIASRNDFIFNLLCCFPFAYLHISNSLKIKKYTFLFILICFLAVSFSEGRAGFILFLLQLILIYFHSNSKKLLLPIKSIFTLLVILIVSFFLKESIVDIVKPFSSRTANLLTSEGDGDFNNDKSLMLRLLMVDKAIDIFMEHPVTGIGLGNFTRYDEDLFSLRKYDRLLKSNHSDEYFNSRSSHNTYLQIISEFGILGAIFYLILFTKIIILLSEKLFRNKLAIIYIPIITILIYFWFISALTGSITWVIIGISKSNYLQFNK